MVVATKKGLDLSMQATWNTAVTETRRPRWRKKTTEKGRWLGILGVYPPKKKEKEPLKMGLPKKESSFPTIFQGRTVGFR